jgi:hypothetical protein
MRFGERTRPGVSISTFGRRPSAGISYGVATGGTSSSITDNSIAYTLLSFTSDGTLTVTKAGLFDILCVGGGGGGGAQLYGGEPTGGGGGGMACISTLFLPVASYTVDVGVGGAGGDSNTHAGSLGETSVIFNAKATTSVMHAIGGQGGAGDWGGVSRYPGNQGGQSYRNGYNQTVAGAISLHPLGYNGGGSQNSTTRAGGGAGAGGDASDSPAGTAGIGRTLTFTGSSVTFGQGGGGGTATGLGTNTPSTVNSGNGGNGRQSGGSGNGGNGQAGAIYVRFRP